MLGFGICFLFYGWFLLHVLVDLRVVSLLLCFGGFPGCFVEFGLIVPYFDGWLSGLPGIYLVVVY